MASVGAKVVYPFYTQHVSSTRLRDLINAANSGDAPVADSPSRPLNESPTGWWVLMRIAMVGTRGVPRCLWRIRKQPLGRSANGWSNEAMRSSSTRAPKTARALLASTWECSWCHCLRFARKHWKP